jgi:hypothetical protein
LVTVTVWLHVLLFPHESVTNQVRVISRGQEPLVTVLKTEIEILVPQQLVAVGGVKTHFDRQPTTRLVAQSILRQHGPLEHSPIWALRNVLSKK